MNITSSSARAKNRRGILTHPVTLAAVAGLLLLSIGSYMYLNPGNPPAVVPTAKVRMGQIYSTVYLSGEVDVNEAISVQTPIAGQVINILVQPGTAVKTGQPLVQLNGYVVAKQNYDTMVNRLKMMQQLASLAQQKLNLDQQHSATPATIQQDQAAVHAAQIQIQVANTLSTDAAKAYDLASQVSPQQAIQAQAALDKALTTVSVDEALLQQANTKLTTDQQSSQQQYNAQISQDEAAISVDQQQLNADEQVVQGLQQELFQGQQSNTEALQSAKQTLDQANGQVSLYELQVTQDQNQLNTDQANNASASMIAMDQANLATAEQELTNAQQLASDAQTQYNTLDSSGGSVGSASEQVALDKAQGAVNVDQAILNQAKIRLQNDRSSTSSALTIQQDEANIQVAQQQLNQAQTLLTDARNAFNIANQVNQIAQNQAKTNADQAAGTILLDKASLEQAQVKLFTDSQPASKAVLVSDEQALVQAKIAVDQAKLDVINAKNSLDQNQLTAPVDGVVVSVSKVIGDSLEPGETVCTVNPNAPDHQVIGLVAASDVSNVKAGDPVTIHSNSFKETLKGTVSFVSPVPQITQNTNTYQYQVYIHVPTLPTDVRSGMPVSIDVQTGMVSHVPVIPTSAVMIQGNQTGVYVQQKPNHFQFVAVTILQSDSQYVEVSHLKPGTVVALKKPNP